MVGMEKEQKQELGWRVSVLPIPAFHQYSGMQEWVIQIPSIPILVSVLFPSLHLKYFRIKFLLLVCIEGSDTPNTAYEISKFSEISRFHSRFQDFT